MYNYYYRNVDDDDATVMMMIMMKMMMGESILIRSTKQINRDANRFVAPTSGLWVMGIVLKFARGCTRSPRASPKNQNGTF